MDLTPSNIASMFTGYSLSYAEAYTATKPWAAELATFVPSTTESITHGWMDKVPKLREWIGPRQVQNASLRSRIVTNKTFELTMAVPKEKIEDDQYGLYQPMARHMGEQAAKWADRELAALILANPEGFDGVSFFNDAHPVNLDKPAMGTYDNKLALALNATNYGIARKTMRTFKGADGERLGVVPSLLVVPPSLEEVARQILNADYLPAFVQGNSTAGNVANMPNIWKGSASLLVIDELEDEPTAWYLLDNRSVIKPFVFQLRQAPNFVYRNKPSDDNVFWTKEFVFGVDARGVADVSLPFLALKSIG